MMNAYLAYLFWAGRSLSTRAARWGQGRYGESRVSQGGREGERVLLVAS